MVKLFGIDIAQIVADEIAGAGGVLDGVLTKVAPGTRTGNLTGGTNPTTTDHAFKGFIDNRTLERRSGQLTTRQGKVVTLLGATIEGGVTPENGDRVKITEEIGSTPTEFTIVELLTRDPAKAVYEVLVEGSGTPA